MYKEVNWEDEVKEHKEKYKLRWKKLKQDKIKNNSVRYNEKWEKWVEWFWWVK